MVDKDLYKESWTYPNGAPDGDVGQTVAALVINLWEKLSHRDVSLEQIASGFRRAGLADIEDGQARYEALKPLVDDSTYEMLLEWPIDTVVD